MTVGKRLGIYLVELGACDTLLLEIGFPPYVHELDETTKFLEAGFDRYFKK